eukprot:CAMPEP_0115697704 /NCGR_PEP_ID=MMETSP0272-20121206/65955_1 /TAXON_ID=71861 /ORGANISM="Scrippsiella trochoidea, Strain CCMP3099" /LENGTH=66 /DNA_ID=CAMNT_0003138015 /DNA_START=370 /DNA_END=570 /DNA_ORIENTATION=-
MYEYESCHKRYCPSSLFSPGSRHGGRGLCSLDGDLSLFSLSSGRGGRGLYSLGSDLKGGSKKLVPE